MEVALKRSFDHKFIESIITHPSVIGGAMGWEGIDFKSIVEDINNYLLVNDFGGFIVINRTPCIYECHTQFLPKGRGEAVRSAVVKAVDYMFVNTDCQRIITKAYKNNPASISLSDEFFIREGETPDYYYYSMDYRKWVATEKNRREGEKFHLIAGESTNHEEDHTHDFYVGAAIRMAKAGNIEKAQYIYNDWATMSGYELAVIVKKTPLLVSIGDMVIEIGEEVVLCQQAQQ